jgi:hypothetical protein
MTQETLEEAVRDYIKGDDLSTFSQRAFFMAGAKWQAERMYSEEEVEMISRDAYEMGRKNILIGVFNKWFKQLTNKKTKL